MKGFLATIISCLILCLVACNATSIQSSPLKFGGLENKDSVVPKTFSVRLFEVEGEVRYATQYIKDNIKTATDKDSQSRINACLKAYEDTGSELARFEPEHKLNDPEERRDAIARIGHASECLTSVCTTRNEKSDPQVVQQARILAMKLVPNLNGLVQILNKVGTLIN